MSRGERSARLRWVLLVGVLGLGGCSGTSILPEWLGAAEEPPLPGERISVLEFERSLEPDPRIADLQVRLPAPYVNAHWPQAGGSAGNAMHHLALGDQLSQAWSVDIGTSAGSETRLLTSPIVANGVVYAMDAQVRISAFAAADGRQLWRVDLLPEEEDEGEIGGGMALNGTTLYVATAYGEVLALDPRDGSVQWRRAIGIPIRAEPTVADGNVYVVTYDNQLFALNAEDGAVVWNHVGIAEVAGLIGGASPAAEAGVVVAPYSSGELFALRADNGRVAWSDSLTRRRRSTGLGDLSDINGRPVIDRGQVFAASHAGLMVAIDLRTGERIWDQELASVDPPWVAGDFIFLLTTDNELVALARRDGRVRWVRRMPRFEDEEDRRGPIQWYGPVLAGDRLIVVSSTAEAVSVSPYDGEILGRLALPDGASMAPIVANKTLFILTDDARLTAWR